MSLTWSPRYAIISRTKEFKSSPPPTAWKACYCCGDVEVNLRSYQVLRGGKTVEFSSKEFELLKHFLCHSGETLSRDRLLDEVWGYENFPTTRTLDAHIVRIRQKLEPVPEQPRFFLTVHGVGYKFVG